MYDASVFVKKIKKHRLILLKNQSVLILIYFVIITFCSPSTQVTSAPSSSEIKRIGV